MRVSEIFVSIQGEGPSAGIPALFIRLAGCDLNCKWCDTPQRNNVLELSDDQIKERIFEELRGKSIKHMVITGGEPSLQIKDIIAYFNDAFFLKCLYHSISSLEIETNGYNGVNIFKGVEEICKSVDIDFKLICSPKFGLYSYPRFTSEGDNIYFKLVVSSVHEAEYFLDLLEIHYFKGVLFKNYSDRIYFQPLNCSFSVAKELIAKNVLGCRLSMQWHKIIGVE